MTSTHPDFAGVDTTTMTDADMLRHFNDNRVEPTRLLNGKFLSVDSERGVCGCSFEIVPAFCHSQGRICQGGFLTGMIDIAMAHAARPAPCPRSSSRSASWKRLAPALCSPQAVSCAGVARSASSTAT